MVETAFTMSQHVLSVGVRGLSGALREETGVGWHLGVIASEDLTLGTATCF